MESDKQKKTRYRVPTVCSVCRRRKMKCDKAKPHCTSCVRNETTHLCVYEEQPWASNNEIQKLKDQIFQLQSQNNELKQQLFRNKLAETGGQNLLVPDEPATDPILDLTKDFNVLMLKENKMSHYGSTSFMATVNNDPILKEIFRKYVNTQYWGVNLNKFYLYDQGIIQTDDGPCGTLGPTSGASVFETTLEKNHRDLVHSINQMLPSKEALMDLIDHFFAEPYTMVPYIDEKAFRHNMDSLISSNPDGKAILVVSNATLLVSVALLLTVLRFAFISLPYRKNTAHNLSVKGQKILDSGVSIGPNYIEYAKACIANASALRKPTLKHIQALLMLRLYRYYAPEDGDDSTDSTIFLALIIQMAKMHGLHRDPDSFPAITDETTANVWRKIWAQLMYLDAIQAFVFGCPLLIDDEYDTRLPVAHINDTAMERGCIEWFKQLDEVTQLHRCIVKSTSRIASSLKRSDLENTLKRVEFALQRLPDINDLISTENDGFLKQITKMKDLILKTTLYTLHSTTNFILMLTCGPQEIGMTQKYLLKSSSSAFILFRFDHHYAANTNNFYRGMNFESFLSAAVFESAKRISQMVISFCLRDLSNILNLSKCLESDNFNDSKGLLDWLTSISPELSAGDQCVIRLQEFVESTSRLQHRFFVCWRIVYMNKLFLDYLDEQFPGKFAILEAKAQQYNGVIDQNSVGSKVRLDAGESPQGQADPVATGSASTPVNFWNELVDSSNQSRFDYLSPNFDKFKDIGDPFFNSDADIGLDQFTSQNYNSFLDSASAFLDPPTSNNSFNISPEGYNPFAPGTSTTVSDGVSPNSDSSHSGRVQNVENTKLVEGPGPKSPNNVNNLFDDTELALQVAKSMFGGSGDIFVNEYHI